jgi:UPF0716 protein FxsA
MSTLSRLALLFVGIPLLELFILIQVGQMVGLWPTIGLVVVTGFLGAALARAEGLKTLWRLQGELAQGRLPGGALLDGFAILVGGALLLTPGILTDVVGFSFLLPFTRKALLKRVQRSLEAQLQAGTIRVTQVSGLGGGASFGWGGPAPWGPGPGSPPGAEEPLDPSREIVVEPGEPGKD